MALKSLKPSMREKKRYLLLSGNFTKDDVEKAILDFVGVLGHAKASPMWISKNILSVNRKEIDRVRASLAYNGKIKITRVSGTLKALKNKGE